MPATLHDHNTRQLALAERLCEAMDTFLDARDAHRANLAAEANRPETQEPDALGLRETLARRQQSAFSLLARVQDAAGLEFLIETGRVG